MYFNVRTFNVLEGFDIGSSLRNLTQAKKLKYLNYLLLNIAYLYSKLIFFWSLLKKKFKFM